MRESALAAARAAFDRMVEPAPAGVGSVSVVNVFRAVLTARLVLLFDRLSRD